VRHALLQVVPHSEASPPVNVISGDDLGRTLRVEEGVPLRRDFGIPGEGVVHSGVQTTRVADGACNSCDSLEDRRDERVPVAADPPEIAHRFHGQFGGVESGVTRRVQLDDEVRTLDVECVVVGDRLAVTGGAGSSVDGVANGEVEAVAELATPLD